MATDNKNNHSKSLEYEDAFEDQKFSFEQNDSFGNKFDEVYNEHKKIDGKDEKFESQNTHRPLSKYQRSSSAKREPNPNETQFDLNKFKERFNTFLKKNRISQNDFSENTKIFVTKDELKDLFKNIHFDIYNNEIDYLFNSDNSNKDDGFLYVETFLERYQFEFYPIHSQIENSKNESSVNDITNKDNKYNPNSNNVNEDFAAFKNDILNIIEGTETKKGNKQLPPIIADQKKKPRRKSKKVPEKEESLNQTQSRVQTGRPKSSANGTIKQKSQAGYLKQTMQREMLEEEMMKLAIEKRNKEFQRDCVRKMVLANEYAETLGKPVSYSAYSEEGQSAIVCRVWNKEDKEFKDINLKQFMIEFNYLQKKINENEERKKYREVQEEDKNVGNKKGEADFFKMNRSQKHKVIKQILKESLELKILLKKQLKALRDKNLIDVSIINKNLRLTNLDDDSII